MRTNKQTILPPAAGSWFIGVTSPPSSERMKTNKLHGDAFRWRQDINREGEKNASFKEELGKKRSPFSLWGLWICVEFVAEAAALNIAKKQNNKTKTIIPFFVYWDTDGAPIKTEALLERLRSVYVGGAAMRSNVNTVPLCDGYT